MNVRVEYDKIPIRHIAVQCTKCGNWFAGREVTSDGLFYEHQISRAQFFCPICQIPFGADEFGKDSGINIQECAIGTEVYKACIRRKEVWE